MAGLGQLYLPFLCLCLVFSFSQECSARPLIVGSSVTYVTVNGTQRQLVVRYDPATNSVLGQSCYSSGCNDHPIFTIKSDVTLLSLTVAAESDVPLYNTTSYWVAGTLIHNNDYSDPNLWIYRCANYFCTIHSEIQISCSQLFASYNILNCTGYYTNILLYPAETYESSSSASYPRIFWVGTTNVAVMVVCQDIACYTFYSSYMKIFDDDDQTQYASVASYDFFASNDPYIPIKYTRFATNSALSSMYAMYPTYNSTTRALQPYGTTFGLSGPFFNMGDPTLYANSGEYGMNRLLPYFYINNGNMCNGFNTGAIWTTAASEGSYLYYAVFNMSQGSGWYTGQIRNIYYEGKNMTKFRMLLIDYYPAFIWLNDHCTVQYMQCQDMCCENISNVQNIVSDLCTKYVSNTIRYQILSYETSYPTLLISGLRRDSSDHTGVETLYASCTTSTCSQVSSYYVHNTTSSPTTPTTTGTPTTSKPTPSPTPSPTSNHTGPTTPAPTSNSTTTTTTTLAPAGHPTRSPEMTPTSTPTNFTASHAKISGVKHAVNIFDDITYFILLALVVIVLLLTCCSMVCYAKNKGKLVDYTRANFVATTGTNASNASNASKGASGVRGSKSRTDALFAASLAPTTNYSKSLAGAVDSDVGNDRHSPDTLASNVVSSENERSDVLASMGPNGAAAAAADESEALGRDPSVPDARESPDAADAGDAAEDAKEAQDEPDQSEAADPMHPMDAVVASDLEPQKEQKEQKIVVKKKDYDEPLLKKTLREEELVNSVFSGRSVASSSSARRRQNVVTVYNRGFREKPDHLMITKLFSSVFDVYTDIGYILYLYSKSGHGDDSKSFEVEFGLFVASVSVAWICNLFVIIKYLRLEFYLNEYFVSWFYKNNGFLMISLITFSITDIDLLSGIFTSKIFGMNLFCAPVSVNGMQLLKVCTIFSITENIVQFLIQVYVKWQEDEPYTSLTVASLGMTVVDLVFALMNVLIWKLLDIEHKNKEIDDEIWERSQIVDPSVTRTEKKDSHA